MHVFVFFGKSPKQVKERPDVGVYIKDLTGYLVNNADDMDGVMTMGNKNRKRVLLFVYFRLLNRYFHSITQSAGHMASGQE